MIVPPSGSFGTSEPGGKDSTMNNLRLNERNKELTSNLHHRHGQFSWHDENCQIQDYGIKWNDGKPEHTIWCATHGQWAIETPVSITYKFEDGTELTKNL